jgi:predicted dienelactone hydrolase
VRFALDEIARRKAAGDPVLARADLSRVGMSGHSFGSVTTLALVGQRLVRAGAGEPLLIEPRIRAAIAFSPNARQRAGDPATQFGSVRLPVLMLTGTRDGDVMGDGTTPEARTKPFEHMPPPGKYLAVFEGGDHMVFGGHEMRRTVTARDRDIQSDVKALTLSFWNAHLRDDRDALAWLQEGGARSILSKDDRYESKP